jgi:acyl-CoA thioester hydrolase
VVAPTFDQAFDPVFRHVYEVSDADIDFLGHASNIAYLRWVQEVAVAHSDTAGIDHAAYVRLGGLFIVCRAEIDYLRPTLRGDKLEVRTWIGTIHAAKCQRLTEIARLDDGSLVARATTTWGYVDAKTGRPTRIHDEVRAAFHLPLLGGRSRPRSAPAAADGAPENEA